MGVKAMTAGGLRTQAFLQQPERTVNSEGANQPGGYGSVGEVCIKVRPAGGRELQHAGETRSQISHTVEMRDEFDVKPQWRFVLEGLTRVLNVISVAHVDEKGLDLLIMCEEKILEEPVEIG